MSGIDLFQSFELHVGHISRWATVNPPTLCFRAESHPQCRFPDICSVLGEALVLVSAEAQMVLKPGKLTMITRLLGSESNHYARLFFAKKSFWHTTLKPHVNISVRV